MKLSDKMASTSLETVKVDITPSLAEYLKEEQICEEMCKSITESIASTSKAIQASKSALLEEIKTDEDIEGLLHRISEMLSTGSDISQRTELEDDRSVEDILKEAETILRTSSPYFDNCNGSGLSMSSGVVKRTILLDTSRPSPSKKRPGVKRSLTRLVPGSPAQRRDDPKHGEGDAASVSANKECPEDVLFVDDSTSESSSRGLDPMPEDDEIVVTGFVKENPNSTFLVGNEPPPLTQSASLPAVLPKTSQTTPRLNTHNHLPNDHDEVPMLKATIEVLQKQLDELNFDELQLNQQALVLMEQEISAKNTVIENVQKENQKLSAELWSAKDSWNCREAALKSKIQTLEQQISGSVMLSNAEAQELKDKLKDAHEHIVLLEMQLTSLRNEKRKLESSNDRLTEDNNKLKLEAANYKRQLDEMPKIPPPSSTDDKEPKQAIDVVVLESKLLKATEDVTKKQSEINRLNTEVSRLRGELEKICLGSVVNPQNPNTHVTTVQQLQANLAMEHETLRVLTKERDELSKENHDLKRQVKEMESIVIRRTKGTVSNPLLLGNMADEAKLRERLEQKNREMEKELSEVTAKLTVSQEKLRNVQLKYENEISQLYNNIKLLEDENSVLKQNFNDSPLSTLMSTKSTTNLRRPPSSTASSVKEETHLLATIRGLKSELTLKEKELTKVSRELEESRKQCRRIQKDRDRLVNAQPLSKPRGSSKPCKSDSESSKRSNSYNPSLFQDEDSIKFLRLENTKLKDEIKRLEKDLISLHNKRIQDLSDLQTEHDNETKRLHTEYLAKQSGQNSAHLQNQIYTQQMVINHLKQQIKDLEESSREVSMLKAERDHLENSLMEANKKIANLNHLVTPENLQYCGLLEKLEYLERRHELREQKLQSIVRDLIARQAQGGVCSNTCRDKIMNKNREICYYRAEMDKILQTLAEFKWNM